MLFVTASTSPSGVLSVIDGMMVMMSRKTRIEILLSRLCLRHLLSKI